MDDTIIQIGPALILRLHIAPFILYALIGPDESVVAAAGASAKEKDNQEYYDQA
jgi:hypothetical protein